MVIQFKPTWKLIKLTFIKFTQDSPLDSAAIIGFYTIFSLPAVLIIIIRIAGAAFGQEAVRGEVVSQISGIVGQNSAEQIQTIIENASLSPSNTFGTIVGVCTMAFAATTVFVALQNALNAMWEVKAKPGKSWVKLIISRLLSLAMVVSLGFLLVVSLSIEVILGLLNDYIRQAFSGVAIFLVMAGNLLVSFLISTAIFATIFKVLPDVKIRWTNVWIGAIVTAVLFVIGKYGINLYLQYDPLSDTYGAASSMVLLVVWVYYTSIILLLGAEFTLVYSREKDNGIQPAEYAVKKEHTKLDHDI
ncbi:YihY/virulence factor BrkB family protein [Adhaeribacter radiodurans]|uniref:YihY/virulence factor BrkB family protein n=1 Tax=Adhaeribacter radiodurans TaxID=2745197 RepID=A0A7L7L501_9BACT|nr:YihY/virulence factor BrkB family protein [Adhaeribacter radiodurans]QMU27853.1 YihY/virulence factor BrkB family protein [Adhaeribacter radiodurans]